MLFSSIVFIFTFLPITLLLYFVVPRRFKNLVILLCSLVFYAWGEPVYIFLMVISILLNYICGLDIESKQGRRSCRGSLIFAIAVNLAILGFFKYYGFLLDNVNAIMPFTIPGHKLSLPIGISFYTFQALSYDVDVYRGKVRAQRNIINFGAYITMFPQLIAGPIVQYADVERQLKHRKESLAKFGEGAIRFIIGLAKKVLLANTIGMVFTAVTALRMKEMSVVTAWLGCAAYTFQIYFDFSGYSDMAIGLGKMFGFTFKENFNYPYISKNITEFWRRWHMSLGSWFREYVYIPLGGNRVSFGKHIRNILVVWMLTGLWHGASWNFVAWGLYYGVLLLLEKYVWGNILKRLPGAVQVIYSMFFVMTGWVFFFSDGLMKALAYLKRMFGLGAHGFIDRQAVYLIMSNWMLWIFVILGCTPVVAHLCRRLMHSRTKRENVVVECMAYGVILILCVAFLVANTYNPFLYFRF